MNAKKPIDKTESLVVDSEQDMETGDDKMPSRTRTNLLNMRRMLRGTLDYIDQTLKRDGVKL